MQRRRRHPIAVVLLAVMSMLVTACGDSDGSDAVDEVTDAADQAADAATEADAEATDAEADGAAADPAAGAQDGLRVAVLIPGEDNDNSFSQSGAEAIRAAAETDGAVDFTLLQEITEPTESVPAIRQFAEDGFDLVIGHGIEYVDPILEVAPEYPEVAFAMSGGITLGIEPSDNVNDWLYNLQDMAYPLGVVAAEAIVGDTIGIVGGPELGFVQDMHAAFEQAALSVRDDLEFTELFAGSFTDAQAAAEATQALIDQGAELIYCSGDGICIGSAQAASAAGIPIVVGFGPQFDTAPDVALAATRMQLTGLFGEYFDLVRTDAWGGQFFGSGIANGQVEVMPISTEVTTELSSTPAELQQLTDDFVADVQAGTFEIPFPATSG